MIQPPFTDAEIEALAVSNFDAAIFLRREHTTLRNAPPLREEQTARALRQQRDEIARLKAALREIATGRDSAGLLSDFPRELAQEALTAASKERG